MSNSSPAVLDSSVIFWAKLRDFTGHLVDTDKFEYVWHDGDMEKVTWDDFTSSITRVYREGEHIAGTYSMIVTVLKDKYKVAIKAMDYNLTGNSLIIQPCWHLFYIYACFLLTVASHNIANFIELYV